MTSPHVVIGATGAQGGAVVDALIDRDIPVRAVVRDQASRRARSLAERGVELAPADLRDVGALADAFSGAIAGFALTTPFEDGVDAEVEQGLTILRAAQRADLPYLVFSSVANAGSHTGIPHFESKWRVEQALAQSGLTYTVVGPTYFYDNVLGSVEDLQRGRLVMAVAPDQPLKQLSRRDLGRFVAGLLTDEDRPTGRRIDIASDAVTPRQMAGVFADLIGAPIEPVWIDPRTIANPDMRRMYEFFGQGGYTVDLATLHRDYPTIGWQTFREWAAEALTGR